MILVADGQHDSSWHTANDDKSLVIDPEALSGLPRKFKPRKRMGWLAHYNAACFYSLALSIDDGRLPPGYSSDKEEWEAADQVHVRPGSLASSRRG